MMWPTMMGGDGWGGIFLIVLGIALRVVLVWAMIRFVDAKTTTLIPPATSVPCVHILDGHEPHALLQALFTRQGAGTMIIRQVHASRWALTKGNDHVRYRQTQ